MMTSSPTIQIEPLPIDVSKHLQKIIKNAAKKDVDLRGNAQKALGILILIFYSIFIHFLFLYLFLFVFCLIFFVFLFILFYRCIERFDSS